MKVLIHVNELEKWESALANIKNLKKATKIQKIALVLNGEAVNLVTDPSRQDEVLAKIKVFVCNHSLRRQRIDRFMLLPIFKVVDSGVVKIVELQNKGYRYIKP